MGICFSAFMKRRFASMLAQVEKNDPKRSHFVVDYKCDIEEKDIFRLFDALKNNTHVEVLTLHKLGLNDRHAAMLADALEENTTLEMLDLRWNDITFRGVLDLLRGIACQQTVRHFYVNYQTQKALRVEQQAEMASAVETNPTIVDFGYDLSDRTSYNRILAKLQQNTLLYESRRCSAERSLSPSVARQSPESEAGQWPAPVTTAAEVNQGLPQAERGARESSPAAASEIIQEGADA